MNTRTLLGFTLAFNCDSNRNLQPDMLDGGSGGWSVMSASDWVVRVEGYDGTHVTTIVMSVVRECLLNAVIVMQREDEEAQVNVFNGRFDHSSIHKALDDLSERLSSIHSNPARYA